jgi:hypothetical protein
MGNHEKMVRKSIDLLEQVISLFKVQVVDDVHLSKSTAEMIEGILGKVKQTMIRMRKQPRNTSSAPSRDQSHPTSPVQHADDRTQEYLDAAAAAQHYNSGGGHGFGMDQDPLASIEARPMGDFSDRTFIPPPNWGNDFDGAFMEDAAIDQSVTSDNNADWLALPLDGMLNKDASLRVDQGFHGIGPMVGQHDLLEVLIDQPYDQNFAPWNNNGQGNFQNFQ